MHMEEKKQTNEKEEKKGEKRGEKKDRKGGKEEGIEMNGYVEKVGWGMRRKRDAKWRRWGEEGMGEVDFRLI